MTKVVSTETFINSDFLLENKYSKELFHDFADPLPIIDYHNHLSSKDLAEDAAFENITQLWIKGDHYKWRAMRTLGVSENYITGKANDEDKFLKWGYTVPYTMGNPLYHWTHLELSRYFDEHRLLTESNAIEIYRGLNEKVVSPEFSARSLISRMNVAYLCTTDDPLDNLEYHAQLAKSGFNTKVSAAFRPDKAILIEEDTFNTYVDNLAVVSDLNIKSYDTFLEALKKRMLFFNAHGCSISDHGLPHLYDADFKLSEVKTIFEERRKGKLPNRDEALKFKSAVLLFLAEAYHELGWVQQYHLGPIRNASTRLFKELGPDTGFDSIGDGFQAEALIGFMNRLDKNNKLTKTVIYNSNPAHNAVFATAIGNFNDGSIKGKIQWGSGWWFLDQKDGMELQIKTLANMGLISCFIGMLTDSRSLLSFPRHEYFRRILCNYFGNQIDKGELPADMQWIGKLVQDICYNNVKEYLNL